MPTLLAFGVAVALILFLATRFNVDWGVTWDSVRGMNLWLYLLAMALYYLSFLFRGLRWRMLARNAGVHTAPGARIPTVFQCSRLIVIGWFVNSVTWLRLGDAYRAYAFSEDSRGSFSVCLGTVLAERVLDMAVVFAVLMVSAVFLITARDSAASIYILVAASVMVLGLSAVIVLMKVYGARLARFLPRRLETAYHRFHQGTLGSFKRLPAVGALGLAGWFLEIGRLFFVVHALGLGIELALVPVVALGSAILSTAPTPGGVGFVEPGVTGLLLISLDRHEAVSVAVVDRSITYLSVIVLGGLIFSLRQIGQARQTRLQLASGIPAARQEQEEVGHE